LKVDLMVLVKMGSRLKNISKIFKELNKWGRRRTKKSLSKLMILKSSQTLSFFSLGLSIKKKKRRS